MSNKHLLSILISTSSLLLSGLSQADMIMTKDEWLSRLKQVVPSLICKSFLNNNELGGQLRALAINYDKCITLIPASFDICQANYYKDLPQQMRQENSSTWGRTMGECIGQDFAKKYLAAKSNDLALPPKVPAKSPLPSTTSTTIPSLPITTTTPTSADSMPKDEWLAKLKTAVPDLICNGFLQDDSLNKQLTKVHINYDTCIRFIPASVERCEHQFYTHIPASITEEDAEKWGHTIGECIGKDFAIKHLFSDSSQDSDETSSIPSSSNS